MTKFINLIGISGKIGSGKDTVGKIIQLVTHKHNFSNEMILHFLIHKTEAIDLSHWAIKKFAGKLKDVASMLTGIPVYRFEDQEFKKTNLGLEWNQLVWNDPDPIEGNDYRITSRIQCEDNTSLITYNNGYSEAEVFDHEIKITPMTVRELLQKLGTEAMRNGLHPNTWVNALMSEFIPYSARGSQYEEVASKWIITDTRFPNEAQAIKKRGGVVVRINRGIDNGSHPSETALDDYPFDYIIDNNGSIEDLISSVRYVCRVLNLIDPQTNPA